MWYDAYQSIFSLHKLFNSSMHWTEALNLLPIPPAIHRVFIFHRVAFQFMVTCSYHVKMLMYAKIMTSGSPIDHNWNTSLSGTAFKIQSPVYRLIKRAHWLETEKESSALRRRRFRLCCCWWWGAWVGSVCSKVQLRCLSPRLVSPPTAAAVSLQMWSGGDLLFVTLREP